MTRILPLTIACLATCLQAEQTSDLLRFTNGDQLHGQFQGIAEGPSLVWKRQDLNETAKFGVKTTSANENLVGCINRHIKAQHAGPGGRPSFGSSLFNTRQSLGDLVAGQFVLDLQNFDTGGKAVRN